MTNGKQHKLDATVATLQQRYHLQSLRKGSELQPPAKPPHIPTSFPQLDAITGCHGLPLGAITLLSGGATSGKLTLAYRMLASAQQVGQQRHLSDTVAILDLHHTSDPAYLHRCGVNLGALLIVRPHPDQQVVDLLLDLVSSRQFRLVLVATLTELLCNDTACQRLNLLLPHLRQAVRMTGCGLVLVDEPRASWLRWLNLDRSWLVRHHTALHLLLQRERWLFQAGEFTGYATRIRVLKSLWATQGLTTIVEIILQGMVKTHSV